MNETQVAALIDDVHIDKLFRCFLGEQKVVSRLSNRIYHTSSLQNNGELVVVIT